MITAKQQSDLGHIGIFFLSQTTRKSTIKAPLEKLYWEIAKSISSYFPPSTGDVSHLFKDLQYPLAPQSGLSNVYCKLKRPLKAKSPVGCLPLVNRTILAAQCVSDHRYLVLDYPKTITKNYVDKVCKNHYDITVDDNYVYFRAPNVLLPLLSPDHISKNPPKSEAPWTF